MDGSVKIGVSLDTSAIASQASSLESQLANIGVRLNETISSSLSSVSAGDGISAILSDITQTILSSSASVSGAVRAVASEAISAFSGAGWAQGGAGAMASLKSGVSSGGASVLTAVRSVASSAASSFSGGSWLGIGKSMMTGIASGIRAAGAEIVSAIRQVSAEAEAEVKSYYKIQSPSALMRDEVGVMISRGIADGILDGSGFIDGALSSVYPSRSRGYTEESGGGKNLVQNIYLRDDDSSPYASAKRIKKVSAAVFR